MRLLYARDQLVGFGDVHAGRAYARIAPGVRGRGLGGALLAWCEGRALEQTGARPARLGQTVNDRATDAIALLHRRGYAPTYSLWVLRLGAADARALQDVAPPPGIRLRSMREGEERAVFEVIERAFSEWPGRSPSTFEAWHSRWLARSDFDPSLLLLAEDEGGELVGALYAIYFPSEGWVQQLAVDAAHRRRGIARSLLASAFSEFARRGVPRIGLNTDSQTGALGLYTRLGMQVALSFTHYAKTLAR
jgi:GNAT superfamily N-acetyltransferase